MSRQCIVCGRTYANTDVEEHLANNHLGPHEFWFNMKKYITPLPSMTVGELVRLVDASPLRFVYLDKFGRGRDECMAHDTSVDLTNEPHFYTGSRCDDVRWIVGLTCAQLVTRQRKGRETWR